MGQWETVSDSVAAFRDDCLQRVSEDIRPTQWPSRTEIFRAYRDWCEIVGRRPTSASEFYSRLAAYGFDVSITRGRRVLPVVLDASELS